VTIVNDFYNFRFKSEQRMHLTDVARRTAFDGWTAGDKTVQHMSAMQAERACCEVLLVDDDQDVREAVARRLRLVGAHVRTTAMVGEALLFMEELTPTHILLDLTLPDAGGVVVLRAARRHYPGIRVALISSQGADSRDVVEAARWSPDATFRKPFRSDHVLAWLGCG
jgi:DNA-binding NtrC family response regulator